MIQQLEQETLSPYAADATVRQEPQGVDRSRGAQVGRTIPAKWWNWLFNAITKRAGQAKNDSQAMLTEMQNVVLDTGATLDSSDSSQLADAIRTKASTQLVQYIDSSKAIYVQWQTAAASTFNISMPKGTMSGSTQRNFDEVKLVSVKVSDFSAYKGILSASYVARFKCHYEGTPAGSYTEGWWPGCIFSLDQGATFKSFALRDFDVYESNPAGYNFVLGAGVLPTIQFELFEGVYYINCGGRMNKTGANIFYELLLSTTDFDTFNLLESHYESSTHASTYMRPFCAYNNNLYWGQKVLQDGSFVPDSNTRYYYGRGSYTTITPADTALYGLKRYTTTIGIPGGGFVGPYGIISESTLSGEYTGLLTDIRIRLASGAIFMMGSEGYHSLADTYFWILQPDGSVEKHSAASLSISSADSCECLGGYDGSVFWATIKYENNAVSELKLFRSYDGVTMQEVCTLPTDALNYSRGIMWRIGQSYILGDYISEDLVHWNRFIQGTLAIAVDAVAQIIYVIAYYVPHRIIAIIPDVSQAPIQYQDADFAPPFDIASNGSLVVGAAAVITPKEVDMSRKVLPVQVYGACYTSIGVLNRVIGSTLRLG